jgi:hypothetical protein
LGLTGQHRRIHYRRNNRKFIGGDGKTVNEGIDFGVVGSDGRLQKIVGFFGPIKPL